MTTNDGTKRGWFGFSLKTMFVVMTVLAVWLGFYVKSFRDRRAAVALIERLDGAMGIKYLGPEWLRKFVEDEKYFWDPAGVHFNTSHRISDNDLRQVMKHLISFQRLQDLTLQGSAVTDDGLALLLPLKDKLINLDLASTDVSDAGIVHLKRFRLLQELQLTQTFMTHAGIAELQNALPNCEIDFQPR